MDYLESAINISIKDDFVSEEEVGLINDIFIKSNLPIVVNSKSLIRKTQDFFYTLYCVPNSKGDVIFIKISPHKGIFDLEYDISSSLLKAKTPALLPCLGVGAVLNKLSYCIAISHDGFFLPDAKVENLSSMSHPMALTFAFAHNLSSAPDNIPAQEEMYADLFSFSDFIDALPDSISQSIFRKYPSISKQFFIDFSADCWDFFKSKLNFGGNSVCLGQLRKQDIFINNETGLIHPIFAPNICRGNPLVDIAMSHSLGLKSPLIFRRYAEIQKNGSLFKEIDSCAEVAWVLDCYLSIIDEFFRTGLSCNLYQPSPMLCCQKFADYRGKLFNKKEFKKYQSNLDSIFVEKFML